MTDVSYCFGIQTPLPVHEVGPLLEAYLSVKWEYQDGDAMGGDYGRSSDMRFCLTNNYVWGEGYWNAPAYKKCRVLLMMKFATTTDDLDKVLNAVKMAIGTDAVVIPAPKKQVQGNLLTWLFWTGMEQLGFIPSLAGWK